MKPSVAIAKELPTGATKLYKKITFASAESLLPFILHFRLFDGVWNQYGKCNRVTLLQWVQCSQLRCMQKIRLIENCSEIAAGTRGASLGPGAVKTACFNAGGDLFSKHPLTKVEDENNQLWADEEAQWAKRVSGLVRVFERVSDAVKNVLTEGTEFPVVISGDHGSAGGTIAGIKAAFPNDRLGVVWVDAHADLHSPYTTPSGNMHGMPLATALNEDNRECMLREPNETAVNGWNALKNMGGMAPKVLPGDLVFIAVRDTEEPEEALMSRYNIPNIATGKVREIGVEQTVALALEQLTDCDRIYISFDVDSMDPSISYGTGTPVPNGLSEHQATQILRGLLRDPRVCCFEMVEVNPCLDDKINAMAETAYRALNAAIETIETR